MTHTLKHILYRYLLTYEVSSEFKRDLVPVLPQLTTMYELAQHGAGGLARQLSYLDFSQENFTCARLHILEYVPPSSMVRTPPPPWWQGMKLLNNMTFDIFLASAL